MRFTTHFVAANHTVFGRGVCCHVLQVVPATGGAMAIVNEHPVRTIARESSGWAIAFGGLLIILGLFAIMAPLIAGVAVTALFAWLLIIGGGAHLVLAWHVRGAGAHIWEALIGLAYIVMGVYLFFQPLVGLVALTAVLGAYLLMKGIFQLILWFRVRGMAGAGWMLFDAVVSLILAGMIWTHLPNSSTWVVGTLVGFAILFSGISRIALATSVRRLAAI
jgi:uncharacterized membrane protein HdeD (DUF308 family)